MNAPQLPGWWLSVRLLTQTALAADAAAKARVDVEVSADEWGIPLLNGRRVQGLLAEALRSLPEALAPTTVVDDLVGLPRRLEVGGRPSLGGLQLHPAVVELIRAAVRRSASPLSPETVLGALTDEHAMTARERERFGAPAGMALRRIRVLRQGTILYGRIHGLEQMDAEHLQVLARGYLALRHLGLRRNRGWGHVAVRLLRDGEDRTGDCLDGRLSGIEVSPTGGGALGGSPQPTEEEEEEPRYLHVLLRLTRPVVATAAGGDAGRTLTHDHLPGAMLRGAIASLPRVREDPELRDHLILSGRVRFLPARPAAQMPDGSWVRSLPVPQSWRRLKSSGDLIDLSAEQVDGHAPTLRPDFAYVDGLLGTIPVRVALDAETHIRRGPQRQGRPTEAEGALFAYESIRAEQCFVWTACCADREVERQLRELLVGGGAPALRLGRSIGAHYGGFPEVTELPTGERELNWDRLASGAIPAGAVVQVLLTSDALVRDPVTGRIDPGVLPAAVSSAFRGALEEVGERRFLGTRRWTGVNRFAGLQLGQELAASAGSLLTFRATRAIPGEDVLRVEARGVGERRIDGHGALVVLQPPDSAAVALVTPSRVVPARPVGLDPAATGLQAGLVGIALERELRGLATRVSASATRLPSRATLGRVRAAARRQAAAPADFQHWLRTLSGPAQDALVSVQVRVNDGTPRPLLRLLDELAAPGAVAAAQRHLEAEVGELRGVALTDPTAAEVQGLLGDAQIRMWLAILVIDELALRARR